MIKQEVIDRFLKSVEIRGEDECWHWKAMTNALGVGKFTFEKTVGGKRIVETYFANRIAYEYYTGNSVPTRYLDNICESRDCCNFKHLKPRDFDARFWDNTDRSTGCWLWLGAIDASTGYGTVTIDHESKLVHRVAYETYNGVKIPDGKMVLHSCNNRPCINPDHLRIGTHNDNMQDMVNSGHSGKGEKNNKAVLTEAQVREIKIILREQSASQSQIALAYDVSRSTIKDIASGRCWGWVSIEASSSSCA